MIDILVRWYYNIHFNIELNGMIEFAPISEKRMTYDEAVLYCAFCSYDDHNDWRMLTRDEWYVLANCHRVVTWLVDDKLMNSKDLYRVLPVRFE